MGFWAGEVRRERVWLVPAFQESFKITEESTGGDPRGVPHSTDSSDSVSGRVGGGFSLSRGSGDHFAHGTSSVWGFGHITHQQPVGVWNLFS